MNKILPIALIVMALSFCNNDSKSHKTSELLGPKEKPVIVERSENKIIKPSKYGYFKEWDIKNNRAVKPFPASKKKTYDSYIQVGYNESGHVIQYRRYDHHKKLLTQRFVYNDRGKVKTSTLYARYKDLGRVKVESVYNALGNEVYRNTYARLSGKWQLKYKTTFDIKHRRVKLSEEFGDDKNRIEYVEFKYKKSKLYSKTYFNRDSALMESSDYGEIYLDRVEYFQKAKQLAKVIWYKKSDAPKKLNFTAKYFYKKSNTIIKYYDEKGKFYRKSVENAKGKVIHEEYANDKKLKIPAK
ncbi:MAG TPA: hypothetical protein ENI73_09755 [Spirochaetes bacterium]|nr:hypothetical protein [Spirochaetota bacterium]